MAEYMTTQPTTVWKSNPNATGDADSKLAVRTLPKGTTVNVISEGQTRTSWSTTPILNIGNGEWIDKILQPTAVPLTEVEKQQKLLKTQQELLKAQQDYIESQRNVNDSFLEKHKNHLLIALALVSGYFAYKKFKK